MKELNGKEKESMFKKVFFQFCQKNFEKLVLLSEKLLGSGNFQET